MQWLAESACLEADPEAFHTDAESRQAMRRLRKVAQQHCQTCPVIRECGLFADTMHASGLWAGSFRSPRTGPYTRRPLIPGAPLFELGPKPVEALVGTWVA